ncbi:MAG: vWA domain-containing protein [Candidatus Diapherotrites archaeon]
MQLPRLKSTSLGFVFSVDALVAMAILAGALFLLVGLDNNFTLSAAQSTTIVDDTLFVLENTGFMIETIDNNPASLAAPLIRQQILNNLPSGFDANVAVSFYTLFADQCAVSQNFSACFPDSNKVIGTSGTSAQGDFVSGKKFFLRKQPPGDCNISYTPYAGFSGETELVDWVVENNERVAYFSELYSEAYFAEDEIEFDFNVTVEPSDFVTCDENVTVTLTITSDSSLRLPIEIMVVMDLSRPVADFPAAKDTSIPGTDKNVMVDFLYSANWTNSNCTGAGSTTDCIGVAAYSEDGAVIRNLTSSRSSAEQGIKNLLIDNSGNSIAEGVEVALDTMIDFERPSSREFVVVLSDGSDTSDPISTDLATEAQKAVDNNITIFAVGIGSDVNSLTELETLATATGGEYYYAEDGNSLSDLYKLIANRLVDYASDSNIFIPIDAGDIVDANGGIIVGDQNIVYITGSTADSTTFIIRYIITFPCNDVDVCGLNELVFPPAGTTFTYVDPDGVSHVIDFNASTTLQFKVRDLNVNIIGGEVIGNNEILLDVRVHNVGELDANSTSLKFYYQDPSGLLLKQLIVPPLCSADTPGCSDFAQTYTSVNIDQEGVIYSVINDENSILECPIGNIDAVNCFGGPATEVVVVDYTVWRN